ncbi:hypothetical protein CH305_16110 [Rhodococcus sp. 15-649-2-2]|nr:hypothetical protein CH305_16110 [Rhodococcus sp. 15-649-2-2]
MHSPDACRFATPMNANPAHLTNAHAFAINPANLANAYAFAIRPAQIDWSFPAVPCTAARTTDTVESGDI